MKKKYDNEFLVNESIVYPEIRLIGFSGKQLGIYSSSDALKLAEEEGLDLVVISDKSNPPVCKIIDYGKYKFSQEKKAKEVKRKQHNISLKEVKMRYKIEDHDYKVRLNQASRFLGSGDKVKATITLKGREIQHANLAIELLNKMATDLREVSLLQQKPTKDGRNIIMILNPHKK
uniref:Translation initiation factor IF-3, chloroplastic n=1 Tax=Tolypiocladia glomerulata TaxID=860646 RepID=A0A1Z1MUC6_9FLOR|nr:translation initiation factor 3 [Tolypiocladia glomerulata]ARW69710.1 translation initiation factor 3 [Tolypiocladia glomerulata]